VKSFKGVKALKDAVDALLENDDTKRTYLAMAGTIDRLFKAILPDPAANRFGPDRKAIVVIAEEIRSLIPPADISEVMGAVEELLDDSIVPTKEGYLIREPVSGGHFLDLSKINFEGLKKQFEASHKHIEAEKLRGLINSKLSKMIRLNHARMDYYQAFQKLIEEYNTGAKTVEVFYTALISLAQDLNQEEKRGIAENLSEEELAVFDLLIRPDIKLSRKEREQVKAVAHDLLDTLKAERLVLDWRKRQQSRASVEQQIEIVLDKLPEVYDKNLYDQKCQVVYQHVYDSYYGAGKSIYSTAG